MKHNDLAEGLIFVARYPFVRETVTLWDQDGGNEVSSWAPGVRMEARYVAPDDCETDYIADGVGAIILTIISVHRPGRFPTRVFFTRRWRSPDGKEFGKGGCRCATAEKFRRLARGYAHEFEVRPAHTEPATQSK